MVQRSMQEPKELRKEEGSAVLECALCEGTGADPLVGGRCPTCGGRKTQRIMEPYVRCNHCKGFGVQFNARGFPTNTTCVVCRGKGAVHVSGDVKECPGCQGRGREPKSEFGLPCIVCSGKGVVPV